MVPTHIRNFVYGLANFSAGISLIIVPYIWLLVSILSIFRFSVKGSRLAQVEGFHDKEQVADQLISNRSIINA